MNNIKFSIIIPIYNRESLIENTIISVLKQEYDNWEYILVDDGSTDTTSCICKKYQKYDARIRYLYKENGGVCTARNLGIDSATGDYIIFLDSDNSLMSYTLSVLFNEIIKHKHIDIICFGYFGDQEWIPIEKK